MNEKNLYKDMHQSEPCSACGGTLRYTLGGACPSCTLQRLAPTVSRDTPRSRRSAEKQGLTWFQSSQPIICFRGPHLFVKSYKTSKCVYCEGDPNDPARAAAGSDNKLVYSPHFPCGDCGTHSRAVNSNKCIECHGLKVPKNNIMKTNPSMLIARNEAISEGHSVYRTGRPCSKGHYGWRNVTGACIDCTAGRPADAEPWTGKTLPDGRLSDAKNTIMHQHPHAVISLKSAVSEGHSVYRTGRPCSKGHYGWRRVAGGNCISCTAGKPADAEPWTGDTAPDERVSATTTLMLDNPDLVLERIAAQSLGVKVYRTGRPCSKGHYGWRRVAGSSCIQCAKDSRR